MADPQEQTTADPDGEVQPETPADHAEPALRDIIPRPLDHKVILILILTCVLLACSRYWARSPYSIAPLLGWFGVENPRDMLNSIFAAGPRRKLWQHHYWVAAHCLLYFAVPAVFIKLVLKERLADYGLKMSGWYKRLWIYGGAFGVVLVAVLIVGDMESFQKTYPFYKRAGKSWADFLGWEIPYAVQFFALEFFFRGVLIHGLKHRFGFYSVFIMTVPYCMIHFGKPPLETLGAIVAGVFLGTLSLWTRSIWLGFLIHVSVAVSMDLVALGYRGELKALFGF